MKRTLTALALAGALSSPALAQQDSVRAGVNTVVAKLDEMARLSRVTRSTPRITYAVNGNPTHFQIGPTRAVRTALYQNGHPGVQKLDSLPGDYALTVITVYSERPSVQMVMVDANMDGTVDYASQLNKDGSIIALDPKNKFVVDTYAKSVIKK